MIRPYPAAIRAALAALVALLTLVGCASSQVAPHGWKWVVTNRTAMPVPNNWAFESYGPDIPVWTVSWSEAGEDGQHLAVGALTMTSDQDALLDEAESSLRDTTVGMQTGDATTISDPGSAFQVLAVDYTTAVASQVHGRLWVVTDGGNATAVTLFGPQLDPDDLELIENSLRMTEPDEGGVVAEGWTRVGDDGVGLAVPSTFYDLGAVPNSTRWTANWALLAADGAASQRILVAPRLPQSTVDDAILQIESDAQAGSVPGYGRVSQTPLQREAATVVRTDFTTTDGEGSLWVLSDGTRTAAVQLVVVGPMDTQLRQAVEDSLWTDGMENN